MKRYWDLSDKERAELSNEEYEVMEKVEAMEKGVTQPDWRPEKTEQLSPPSVPDGTRMYAAKAGWTLFGRMAWRTAEEAAKAVDSAVVLNEHYQGGVTNYLYTVEESDDVGVVPITVLSGQERAVYSAAKSAFDQLSARMDAENADRENKATAYTEAMQDIRADYARCLQKRRLMQEVKWKLDEYKNLCDGDEVVAMRFLTKAYSQDDINECLAWFDVHQVYEESLSGIADGDKSGCVG